MTLLSFNFLNQHFYFSLNHQRLYLLSLFTAFLLLLLTISILFRHRKKRASLHIAEVTTAGSERTNDDQPTSIDSIDTPPALTISSKDINAIAGEDSIATQLDLARAYIEAGRKQLARKMLDHVVEQGTAMQQQEAEHLLLLLF
ncbi:MAG: hypothetical protein A3E84_01595 [Gammaproteobacteria bacterium RIFCSPHIGHO2_12_FULL_42_13]|nr:MAG: hypothetical protein A3E84_01595 [Gammaproteobacteria bacterium RIFCSPHIGHO2_12_FULL_42_13]